MAHDLYPPDYSSKEGDLLVRLQPVCLVGVILLQLRHLFVRCTPNLGFSLLQPALLFQSQGRSVGWVPLYILLHISWRSCLERVAGILVRRKYETGRLCNDAVAVSAVRAVLCAYRPRCVRASLQQHTLGFVQVPIQSCQQPLSRPCTQLAHSVGLCCPLALAAC